MTDILSRPGTAVATLAAAARMLAEPGGMPAVLERVVSVAAATIGSCTAAAITLHDDELPLVSVSTADAERSYPEVLDLSLSISHGDGTTKGTLTLFAADAGAFGADDRLLAEAYAALAALAVGPALSQVRAAVHDEQLREAIESRDIIGQAKGILMARENCTADEAFEILRRASQRENLKLREVAARVAHHQSRG